MHYTLTITAPDGTTVGTLLLHPFEVMDARVRANLLMAITDIMSNHYNCPAEAPVQHMVNTGRFPRSFSSTCQRETYCVKQLGHEGPCGPTF